MTSQILRTFQQPITDSIGNEYQVRVCARKVDGFWEGWLEFEPEDGSSVLRSCRETTQPNLQDSQYWASGLTAVYAEGSLARTLDPIVPTRRVSKEEPAYEGPAPSRYAVIGHDPILDPFAVYDEGGSELLRRRLTALAIRHLRHIALHYLLVDPRRQDPGTMGMPELVDQIVASVETPRRSAAV